MQRLGQKQQRSSRTIRDPKEKSWPWFASARPLDHPLVVQPHRQWQPKIQASGQSGLFLREDRPTRHRTFSGTIKSGIWGRRTHVQTLNQGHIHWPRKRISQLRNSMGYNFIGYKRRTGPNSRFPLWKEMKCTRHRGVG